MNPDFLSEIEAALWKNLIDLTHEQQRPGEYLNGYFRACEDLQSVLQRLEAHLRMMGFYRDFERKYSRRK